MSAFEYDIAPPAEITENMAELPVATELQEVIGQTEPSRFERVKNWVGNNRGKLALGLAATSAIVTLTLNPTEEVKDDVIEAVPWVGTGIAVSEGMFIFGAVMMVASIGDKVGNPLKIKSRIPEIAAKANDSNLFKSGFWINTTGAVGTFAVITTGVVSTLPVESYGVLSLGLADLAVTVAVRKAIHGGIKSNVASTSSPSVEA